MYLKQSSIKDKGQLLQILKIADKNTAYNKVHLYILKIFMMMFDTPRLQKFGEAPRPRGEHQGLSLSHGSRTWV
jgi:hypothetical protein